MSVHTFTASDTGALFLTGEAGSLHNILLSSLVTGYGSKQPAGWLNPYTDSAFNSVLKAAPLGNEFYLRINDSNYSHENIMLMSGFSSMTDLNSGENATPSAISKPLGIGVLKSKTKDTTARGWIIIANHKFAYLFIDHNGGDFNAAEGYCFGEFISLRQSDAFNFLVTGRDAEDYSNFVSSSFASFSLTDVSVPNHYLMRSYTQIGSSIACGKHSDTSKDKLPFPNPVDGNLIMSSVFITEPASNCIRGRLPGLWNVCHDAAYFNTGDTFNGNGALYGRTFMIVKVNTRVYAIETSDTWYT
jgi:hypothetical protein